MAVSARKRGGSATVFTLDGTNILCEFETAEMSVEITTEDARGACDDWEYAWSISKSWQLTGSLFVADAAFLLAAAAGDNQITVVFNTGANAYTGTGILTSGSHSVNRSSLQKQSFTIKGQGSLTVA
jgi:hypothetical protein